MSAGCGKHGVDLHGDTFNGLACPVCEVEADRDRLLRDLENANAIETRENANAASVRVQIENTRLREALGELAEAAREFTTQAEYSVEESYEDDLASD